jgi:hypothetical protein
MISKIVRRTHMYLALFLTPWVLMYALSTTAMNHRPFFKALYDDQPVVWETEKEIPYVTTFSDGVEPWMVAEQILGDLELEGHHRVRGRLDDRITITRNDPLAIRRITYTPPAQTLKIERQILRAGPFLEHMHRRRGYDSEYLGDDLWAVSVDLFIAASAVWVLSGLWMWWELKTTRRWGAVCIGGGVAVFAFFLVTI